MGRIITDDAPGIIREPEDPYWDGPISRREVQFAVNDICVNEQALQNRSDTANIVLNFLCEKLEVTKADLDAYVARKKVEAAALADQKAINEQPNG